MNLNPSTTGTRGHIPTRAGINLTHLAALLCAITLGAGLTGCSFLKPAKSTARYFVLTPLPAGDSATAASGSLAVGVGPVKLPAYLFNTSLAIRKGTNEIDYLPSALWAERLDTGFQRVLAANLAIVLPTGQVRLSAWKSEEVAAEAYVAIEQFDVDTAGRGVLVARWRILSPGGDKVLKVGTSRLSRQGPLAGRRRIRRRRHPERARRRLQPRVGQVAPGGDLRPGTARFQVTDRAAAALAGRKPCLEPVRGELITGLWRQQLLPWSQSLPRLLADERSCHLAFTSFRPTGYRAGNPRN